MEIGPDRVATIEYALYDDAGALVETTAGKKPIVYIHGHGQLPPGLERTLAGRSAGTQFSVTLQPEEAYGAWQPGKVVEVPLTELPRGLVPKMGATLVIQGPADRPTTGRVVALGRDRVKLDGNHPLAGKTVRFDVTVAGVRAATSDDLALSSQPCSSR